MRDARDEKRSDGGDASGTADPLARLDPKTLADAPVSPDVPAFETRLTDRLGIDAPVVQAPIGSATCPELAAAVSETGGLGTLAVTWRDPADAADAVRRTRDLTDCPFGVNLVVDPAATEYPTEDHVEACLDAGAPVFSFSFGDATRHVERVDDAGATTLWTVGSAAEARDAVDAGADVVVAQGWEAGGHVQSEVATMPLVPRVADAVPDTPVVAAGGIADGRGLAAAATLGADGVWVGTRFLATEEANVHRAYRRRVVEAAETETRYGTPFSKGWPGTPHRVLRNETTDRWEAAARPESDRPGDGETVARGPDGPVGRYEDSLATPEMEGDVTELPLYAGQSAGLTDDVVPAGDVVDAFVSEAATALRAADGRVRTDR
ncbi:nitronate monooxygenase [Halogeometricum sp. CBA1124]|nr:nitronate monooxygenase [Halogeometricum sp. CBA1124]MUV56342.1 nitronate monooxygenase [Halogeometricum sp. CBA1124]